MRTTLIQNILKKYENENDPDILQVLDNADLDALKLWRSIIGNSSK
jgi:hypothetical protein